MYVYNKVKSYWLRDKVKRYRLKTLRFELAQFLCTLSVTFGVRCGFEGAKVVPLIQRIYREKFGKEITIRQAQNYAQELSKRITAIEIFKLSDKGGWVVRIVQRNKSESWFAWIGNERKFSAIKAAEAKKIIRRFRKKRKVKRKRCVVNRRLIKFLMFELSDDLTNKGEREGLQMVISEEEAGLRVVDNIVRYLRNIGKNISERQARNYAQEISKVAKKIKLYKNSRGIWCAKIVDTDQTESWRKLIARKHKSLQTINASREYTMKRNELESLKEECFKIIGEFELNAADVILVGWSKLDLVQDLDQKIKRFQAFFDEYAGTKAPSKELRDWETYNEFTVRLWSDFGKDRPQEKAICETRRNAQKQAARDQRAEEDRTRWSDELYRKVMNNEIGS